MKKCVCVDEWRWGTLDKQLLYALAAMFFSLGILLDARTNWDIPTDRTRMSIVAFNYIGFLTILMYQIRNKWKAGVVIVSLTLLISTIPLYRVLTMYPSA